MMLLQILLELTAGLYLFHSSANDLIGTQVALLLRLGGLRERQSAAYFS
jgi:hypothetical protein